MTEQTKDLNPKPWPLRATPQTLASAGHSANPVTKSLEGITWKAVEPRHYDRAQGFKRVGKVVYTDYVIALVERVDGQLVGIPGVYGELPIGAIQLSKEQVKQVLEDFEAKFGPKEATKE